VEPAQNPGLCRLIEPLDLAVALGVGLLTQNQQPAQLADDLEAVSSAEARATIQIDDLHQPEAAHQLVQAAQKQAGILAGADHDAEAFARGVVDKEQRDALGSLRT